MIFTKGENRREGIWETHWFNGTIIYRTLLDNLQDCVLVAIKSDIEITTVVNKCKVASIPSPFVQVGKSKLEKRSTHVEADQKRQVVDCGIKRTWKTDTRGTARCVPSYVTNTLFFLRFSDMYAYFASQLNSAYNILNLWQSHPHHIFLEDHSPVNRWQYVLGFCRLSMCKNFIGGSHHLRFISHNLWSH